jgi:hypothetical protein
MKYLRSVALWWALLVFGHLADARRHRLPLIFAITAIPGAAGAVTERKSGLQSPRLPTLGVGQSRVYRSLARYVVLVAGRRFGKSTLEAVRLFNKAYTKAHSENWYIAPTYRQAKTIFWDRLKETIPRMYVLKKNESELTITLKNRSKISLKGADNPDSLRGPGLDHVSFDEFANIQLEAWNVIRPALADRGGTASFVGSPAGFNHLYDFFNRGTIYRDRPTRNGRYPWRNWDAFLFTTLQGGRVPLEEIEAAQEELDPRVFRQEFLASFETLTGRVYGNFSRQPWPLGNIDPHIIDCQGELYIGMDFNINPMSAVVVQKVFGRPEVLDAIQLMTSNTEEMAQHLKQRYIGRKMTICPDASGQYAKGTNVKYGETDITILRRYGFAIDTGKSNPVVVDRINNTQSNLMAGRTAYRALKIHPRCEHLIKALEGLTWKKGTNIVDKTTGLDHITDALGYVLWQMFNVLAKHIPAVAPADSDLADFYSNS